MMAPTPPWESQLLALACAPLHQEVDYRPVTASAATLSRAYAHCAALTQAHSKTFYLASALLPAVKREAMRALYAFCRVSDDLVDRASGNPLDKLEQWRRITLAPTPASDDLSLIHI